MRKLFALLFALGVTLGTAATGNAQVLRFTVPFDFSVNGRTLPASTYTIRQTFVSSSTAVDFVGEDQGLAALANNIDNTATGSKLVFLHVGDKYFLNEVATQNGTLYFETWKQLQRAGDTSREIVMIRPGQ